MRENDRFILFSSLTAAAASSSIDTTNLEKQKYKRKKGEFNKIMESPVKLRT